MMPTHAALHRAWTAAVGTTSYVKDEWKELERVILKSPRDPFVNVPPADLFMRLQDKAQVEGTFEFSDWAVMFVALDLHHHREIT